MIIFSQLSCLRSSIHAVFLSEGSKQRRNSEAYDQIGLSGAVSYNDINDVVFYNPTASFPSRTYKTQAALT